MTNNLRQLEGGRAAEAYKCAQEADSTSPKATQIKRFENKYFESKNYKSYVKKAPMWIKTNGIGAAFAFIISKRENSQKTIDKQNYNPGDHEKHPQNAYGLLYYQVFNWLKSDTKKFLLRGKENQDLVKTLTELKSHEYRAVTVEVLAFLNWLRRFADGLIEGDEIDE
ncbi:MAG: type III-B CRISPR module-associated protein Cmr5 [Lewinellaceae bacterium]|nr:type III-B CRISPR module-associated protein Cmr5 [Lewinellaceae bacterium]